MSSSNIKSAAAHASEENAHMQEVFHSEHHGAGASSAKIKHFMTKEYLIMALFWTFLTGMLLAWLIIFLQEWMSINNANSTLIHNFLYADNVADKEMYAAQLLQIHYPLIDFSLLTFALINFQNDKLVDATAAWEHRVVNINAGYSYLFVAVILAFIVLAFYIIIIIKLIVRRRFERRYKLVTKFKNDYVIFNNTIYLGFIINLTIAFGLFNFISSLILMAYLGVLLVSSYFQWRVLKNNSEILLTHRWWQSSNCILFTVIFIIQNGYSFVEIFFENHFGVDLELILKIMLPVGTITVIITLLIKQMISHNLTSIKNAIKHITSQVTSFQIYYHARKSKAIEDYEFVKALPTIIRLPLKAKVITHEEVEERMAAIDRAVTFFEEHFHNTQELNYMLYHLFHEVMSEKEIEEIKNNVLILEHKRDKAKHK